MRRCGDGGFASDRMAHAPAAPQPENDDGRRFDVTGPSAHRGRTMKRKPFAPTAASWR
ncbi:hypothetical protein D9M68_382590 [compost metagenome]